MPKLPIVARVLLALLLLVGGANGFVRVLPVPMPLHPFLSMLDESGYLYVVKALEMGAGAALLPRRSAALGFVLSAPLVANIALFHSFFDARGLVLGIALVGLWSIAAWPERTRLFALVSPPRPGAR